MNDMEGLLSTSGTKSNPSYYPATGLYGNLTDSIGSRRWIRETIIFSIGLISLIFCATLLLANPDAKVAIDDIPEDTLFADNDFASPNTMDTALLQEPPTTTIEDALTTSDQQSPTPTVAPTIKDYTQTLTLKRGQTLIQAIKKAGVPNQEAYSALAALGEKVDMRRILPGQQIHIKWQEGARKSFEGLWMRKDFGQSAEVSRDESGFVSLLTNIPIQPLTYYAEGTITDSLFLTAEREGVPPGIIVEMIRMFSFDVDFQREIRPGDSFAVYFARSLNSTFGDLRDDHIIYARLTLRGKDIELNRFENTEGDIGYFTADGKSAQKALMKTPIDGARLTSSFSLKRKHPVLGYTRAHKGSDFRAPTGTPIMAAGNGVIERADRYGSFGNYVRIRHNGTYKTIYAHLSRFGKGIKKGARVKQGQIIGYSGATGRVTGAHLHYEVLVNGKQVNPMTLKLPTGRTLAGKELAAYQTHLNRITDERMASQQALYVLRQAIKEKSEPMAALSSSNLKN